MKKYDIEKYSVNDKEIDMLDVLDEKYYKIIKPGIIAKTTKKIGEFVPEKIKDYKDELGNLISDNEIFIEMMKLVDNGFNKIEAIASKYSITEEQIVKRINKSGDYNISKLDDICWLRAYDLSKIVNSYKMQDIAIASIEGAGTGAAGFAGLPFNLVLSTFLYFRAVQTIAMFYGYDIKNNPDELAIAGDVLKKALNPSQENEESDDVNLNFINKVSKKTWSEMASKGGIPLLLTQIRALGHNSAQKALEKAGKSGLEHSIFKDVLTQIGKKLPKKVIPKLAVGVSALFSSLIDGKQMKKVLDYADIFYQKRFILEKKYRIRHTSKYRNMVFIIIGIVLLIIVFVLLLIKLL